VQVEICPLVVNKSNAPCNALPSCLHEFGDAIVAVALAHDVP